MQNTELKKEIKIINDEMKKAFAKAKMLPHLALKTVQETSCIQSSLETHIISPCLDVMSRGGKRLRPLLVILLAKMLKGDEDAAYKFSPIIESIHTASLIHDDIEDGSLKRRGKTAVHIKHGVDVALNAASALYFFAIGLIEEQKEIFQLPLYKSCINSLASLHLGQAMDIKHHSDYSIPFGYDAYQQTARLKTGELFSLAMKAALIFSHKENAKATEALNELGVAFQMLDDLANISSGNKGKDRGDDIVEGKLSFPIVLYLEKEKAGKEHILQLFAKAKKEGIASSAVNECCTLLETSGVLQEGLSMAKKKLTQASTTLESIFGKSLQLDMIKHIFNFQG